MSSAGGGRPDGAGEEEGGGDGAPLSVGVLSGLRGRCVTNLSPHNREEAARMWRKRESEWERERQARDRLMREVSGSKIVFVRMVSEGFVWCRF